MKKIAIIILTSATLSACATYRPILSDNAKYLQVGPEKAEADIDACMAKADAFLEKHKEERARAQAGRQAVGMAIVGGILGAVSGQGLDGAAKGAVAGGAIGATGGYLDEKSKDNLKPDELKQNYVLKCLQQENYEILGWK